MSNPIPIRRDPALIPLSHDHNRALGRARDVVLALDGAVPQLLEVLAESLADYAESELLPHFLREEELLLPAYQASGSADTALIDELLDQHRVIRALSANLLDARSGTIEERLMLWSKALSDHVRFEERSVFKAVQQALDVEQLAALGEAIAEASAGPACSL